MLSTELPEPAPAPAIVMIVPGGGPGEPLLVTDPAIVTASITVVELASTMRSPAATSGTLTRAPTVLSTSLTATDTPTATESEPACRPRVLAEAEGDRHTAAVRGDSGVVGREQAVPPPGVVTRVA